MDTKTLSVEQSLLIHALRSSPKGFALIRADKVAWANPVFYDILGWEAVSSLGRRVGDVWAVCGGFESGLASAFERAAIWEGRLEGDGEGWLRAALTPLGAGEAGLWLERDGRAGAESVEHMLQGVQDWPALGQAREFLGPKSFWRSVGAVWAVCSRNGLPVALAFASAGPDENGADAQERLRAALAASFRRSSDVLGRLGANHYAAFIVGQDAGQVAQRMRYANGQLAPQCWAACAVVGGTPKQGSGSQAIKAQAKKLHETALARQGGWVETESF